ncbi:DUF1080 domain-containing protein [Aureibaculum sp. 2210JD6-5]|uniref:3-keto-disaccharide hydrolase n=1 Tax=Aureibaculum sp. 2210JD6-5 TaxID=3103957 RepID=UPI002AAEDA90|nr:DUF1080 domain-containing protein [Aureibaculum sp. 2210JD6-5]MDY7395750.1 DUF1080 domain-containing protein [Aureibaculum sp. 2210JD6-5]
MIKNFLLSTLVLCLFGCKETATTDSESDSKTDSAATVQNQEKEPTKPEETEIWEPKPPKISIDENGVPSDAIVLFDGKNMDEWIVDKDSTEAKWTLNNDGSMTVKSGSGSLQTKRNFGDIQLHLEWKSPTEIVGEGQSRANSGVFIQQRYEVQILDNNDNDTYVNGQVGAVYKQSIPAVNAAAPTGEWNSYDIIFHAPKFDADGKKTKSGTITVLHNGVLIQDHFEIQGAVAYIGWPTNEPHGDAPIMLQDHNDGSRPSFRNIWVREI